MLSLIVRLRIKSGAREPFLAAVWANRTATMREPGCLQFDVIGDDDDPEAVTFYEIYRDREAHEAHRAAPHFRRWREAAAKYVESQRNELAPILVDDASATPETVVIRAGDAPQVDRGHGVRTTYLVTPAAAPSRFMTGITELEVGAEVRRHSHNCDESVLVLDGTARFESDGTADELAPGDATWVPAGAVHRFVNAGDDRLRIYFIYGRPDPTRTFADTGETVAIGSSIPPADPARS